MKILIIDDSDSSRHLLESILNGAGYNDIITAASAREGMSLIKNYNINEKGTPVDLVLMDIVMPGMNGIEAAKIIKENDLLKDIPIIMVTAEDEEASLEKAFEAGAIDYITKPVSQIELTARVRSVLKLREEIKRRIERERELKSLMVKLGRMTQMDGLTGIANRRFFDETFNREWFRAQRQNASLAVLMIDIDFFKKYNDEYGHLEGDNCLKKVASAIQGSLKRPADFLARFGGEEFVVVLPSTDSRGAANIAEDIRGNIADLGIEHATSDIEDFVTVSIGVACVQPGHDEPPEMLLNMSDQALYQAKSTGRNRIHVSE